MALPRIGQVSESVDNSGEGSIIGLEQNYSRIQSSHKPNDDIGTPDKPICNPLFTSRKNEYTHNCDNCSITYEMRRRGFDVEAAPMVDMLVSDWAKMFVNAQTIYPNFKPDESDVVSKMRQMLSNNYPSGARGSIYVKWISQCGGHFFSWEISGNNVRFLDAQSENINVGRYFEIASPESILYQRWDNLEITDMALNAFKNKGGQN